MYFSKHHQKIRALITKLQSSSERIWFLPLILLLAIIDNIILIIPVDGILISSSMLTPKRWLKIGLVTGIGSTLGAILLYALVYKYGVDLINNHFYEITTTKVWQLTESFYLKYGLYVVLFVSLTPFSQQPAIILAGIGKIPLTSLVFMVLLGRGVKYIIMAYIGSHAPHILMKMVWFKSEMRDSGIDIK